MKKTLVVHYEITITNVNSMELNKILEFLENNVTIQGTPTLKAWIFAESD